MATVNLWFAPDQAAQFLTTAFPQYQRMTGTELPVPVLSYDQTTLETAYWLFPLKNYGASNPTVTIDFYWYATTSTTVTHSVVWGAAVCAMTADTDSVSIEGSPGFGTASTVTDDILGTTAKRPHKCSTTITNANLDSWANDDLVWLKVYRDAGNASDDLNEDAHLIGVNLSYSDT